ncbi:MAG: metal ABC transporter permease, partial [Crocinitomicaceae bacterium]
ILAFDESFAMSKGINVKRWHYVFMTLVSITTVMSFESVGAILVIGLLSIPAASAYLLVKRLPSFLLVSCFFATFGSIIGMFLSIYFDLVMSSMIVVTLGVQFLIVFTIYILKQ